MERKTRLELNELSKEILGGSSKWQKIVKNGVQYETTEKSANGKSIKAYAYMTPEALLENLRSLKAEKEQKRLNSEIQKLAGASAN